MIHSVLTQAKRASAACLICVAAALAVPLNAQTATESHAQPFLRLGYDKAHEITLNGTIQKVVSHAAVGTPIGLHLLVAGSEGTIDAHLGPYVNKEVQQALHTGMAVQIVGAIQRIRGKNYLLAREVVVDGRTITVRSKNGFLLLGKPVRASRITEQLNGGAR